MADLVGALVLPALACLVAWRGWRPVPARLVRQWGDRFRAQLDATTVELAGRRLRATRRTRSTGAAIGILVAGLPAYANVLAPDRAGALSGPPLSLGPVIGAACGALLAEVLVVHRPEARRATLAARRVDDYVEPAPRVAVVGATALAVAAALIAPVVDGAQVSDAWIGAACGLLASCVVWIGLRRVVDRPRLSTEPAMLRLDEALRADGAHQVCGAGVALAATGAAVAVAAVSATTRGYTALASLAVSLAASAALGWWWALARDVRWDVTRAREQMR